MNRSQLTELFKNYQTVFEEEHIFVQRFLDLLKDQDCFERFHLPGHITGSAWIVNYDQSKTLLVHHAKLNRWLQPGGHCDGDENVMRVALREAQEETGVQTFQWNSEKIFDIDIHLIPARKDFPEHFHFDIRFLLEANDQDTVVVSEESHDVRWVNLHELETYTNERSVLRMKEKLLRSN